MRNRSYHKHFAVPVWSRDCEVPDHRVFDVDYQVSKACDICVVYKEMMPLDYVKKVLYDIWMGIDE